MIEVLSWNIQQGGGSRIPQIKAYLQKRSSDIIVLSEFKNNESGNSLRRSLLRHGYIHQAVSHSDGKQNGVCICSKFPMSTELFYDIDPHYSHGILKARFQAFDILGVYLPHKKKHQLFDYLNGKEYDKPTIICGDFNSGINHVDQKGSSFWYEEDLLKLQQKGFHDAFRLIHGQIKEYSWYSHQGNGYRYDHSYISKDLTDLCSDCYYDHDARQNKLSDHSPMILKLA